MTTCTTPIDRDPSFAHHCRAPLSRVMKRCRKASSHPSGVFDSRVQEMLFSYTHPPVPPLARVTEGDPRGGVGQVCARGVVSIGVPSATVPPCADFCLLGPTEERAKIGRASCRERVYVLV